MEIHTLETGRFKLDGGAMFGVVPKSIWHKTNPADEQNRIDMAMRCLLVTEGSRVVVVDAGIGTKYTARFAELYDLRPEPGLLGALAAHGIGPADVTDVVLTHLHFDHCGGATEPDGQGGHRATFPRAQVHVQASHWAWARHPNVREAASFFPENMDPLEASGQLVLHSGAWQLMPGFSLEVVSGHTEAQQLPLIDHGGRKLFYTADLIPTYGHLPVPYVMGYDVRPLLSLEERAHYLQRAHQEEWILVYEHDPYHEWGTVTQDARGKYVSGQTGKINELN